MTQLNDTIFFYRTSFYYFERKEESKKNVEAKRFPSLH